MIVGKSAIGPNDTLDTGVKLSILKAPGGFCDRLSAWEEIPEPLVYTDGESGYNGTLLEFLTGSDHALRDLSLYVKNSKVEKRKDIYTALRNIIDAGDAATRFINNIGSRLAPLVPHLQPQNPRPFQILDPLFLLHNDPKKLFLVAKGEEWSSWEIPKLMSVLQDLHKKLELMQTEHRHIEDILERHGFMMQPGASLFARGLLAEFWMRLATETDCRSKHFRRNVKLLGNYDLHLQWAIGITGHSLRAVRDIEASLKNREGEQDGKLPL